MSKDSIWKQVNKDPHEYRKAMLDALGIVIPMPTKDIKDVVKPSQQRGKA